MSNGENEQDIDTDVEDNYGDNSDSDGGSMDQD
jgi:hypothetical protein